MKDLLENLHLVLKIIVEFLWIVLVVASVWVVVQVLPLVKYVAEVVLYGDRI